MDGDRIPFAGTLKRLGGDVGLFKELAEFYHEDSPALLQEIRDGIESGSVQRIQRAAHRLRSMLENFDVERAVAITRTIEQTCRRGELPLLPSAIGQLEEDMESLDAALHRYIASSHDGNCSRPDARSEAVHAARGSR